METIQNMRRMKNKSVGLSVSSVDKVYVNENLFTGSVSLVFALEVQMCGEYLNVQAALKGYETKKSHFYRLKTC